LPETAAVYDGRVDPDRDAAVDRIVATYELLMHRVASTHTSAFLDVGVTMSQAKVLYLVQGDADLRMSDLSMRLGVSLSTMSGVVDRLVDQGLLTRRDDPADRRHVVLRITGAGSDQLQAFRELTAGQLRAVLARVPSAELNLVGRALDTLAAASADAPGGDAASPVIEGEPA
jgi:DNA-binding MarR family transcriptional regulator